MKRVTILGLLGGLLWTAPVVAQQVRPARPDLVIGSWYQRFLNRTADPKGMINGTDQLKHGQPAEKVLADLLGGKEYYDKVGNTPEAFIRALFQDLLGRQPTQGELGYWRTVASNEGRTAVASGLLVRYPDNWRPHSLQVPRLVVPPSPYHLGARNNQRADRLE